MHRLNTAPKLRRQKGTSLVEILVVIVVFLTGILAVVQIFPGGFRLLNNTRSNTVALNLARTEIERLKGQSEQLPEQIVPVTYVSLGGGGTRIDVDPSRNVNDLSPSSGVATFAANGDLQDASGNALGNWKYLSGANVIRRVIGEGRRVPSPSVVNGLFGSRMSLNFGPVLIDPNYQGSFQVYGNDMLAIYGVVGVAGVRDYEYFLNRVQYSDGTITLPSGPNPRTFRLALSFDEQVGTKLVRRETVGLPIAVAANAPNGYQTFSIGTLLGIAATYAGAEPDSIRVQRMYDQLPAATLFSADPFEYKMDIAGTTPSELGVLTFNPAGYGYDQVLDNGRRVPLVARVDYDVYDWRVLREDFRIPDALPANYRLPLGNLKVAGGTDVDGSKFSGMNFKVPDGAGGYSSASDFVLMDVQTGGVYLYNPTNPADPTPPAGSLNEYSVDPTKSSYTVDKSLGVVRFNDFDRDGTNGLQLQLLLPGATSPTTVNASGRAVRALYMARNEWAVQVYKAAEQYFVTYAVPNNDSYYVGTSAGAYGLAPPAGEIPGLAAHRIYFPESDNGRKVVIDTIIFDWTDSGNIVHTETLQGQAFTVGRDRVTNDFDPYVDIQQAAFDYVTTIYSQTPNAVSFDFASYGYAVRGVKGASVNVRVLWNPQTFNLNASSATNLQSLDKFAQGYRRTSTETFLTKAVQ